MKNIILFLSVLFVSFNANAETYVKLQTLWDKANFIITEQAKKEELFKRIDALADKMVEQHKNDAKVLAWSGIIKATKAGVQNNLGSLGLLDDARKLFEESIKIDPTALNYAATTSLGSLYFQVPGWPLSFKDNKKAKELLELSLKNVSEDIEANYFYAQFLLKQGKKDASKQYFMRALNAPAREFRDIADTYRKKEIEQILAEKFKK